MIQATFGQGPSVRVRHGKPTSRLVQRTLPKLNVSSKNGKAWVDQLEAEQMAAESETHSDAQPVSVQAPVREEAPFGPVSPFERNVDAVLSCIGAQNALREILYKTLVFCGQCHAFEEVETFIMSSDEYAYNHLTQTPYTLIHMLVRAGGLDATALDEGGEPLGGPAYEGFTPEDFQAVATTFLVQTSPAGAHAASLIEPAKRLKAQIVQHPHRADTYYRFMTFCREPRTLPEIQRFYDETPGLAADTVQIHHTLAADFYIDKLEKAGVLVWRGAWVLNEAGEQLLADREARSLEE